MTMIEKLVELRIDTFIKEFDININYFDFNAIGDIKKVSWEQLKQKFIKCNLVSNNSDVFDCYCVIKNIIWKNIITYNIIDNKLYMYMNHYNFRAVRESNYLTIGCLSYNILLNKHDYFYPESKYNCTKLETKIINYMMLLDTLVTQYMISDLVYMFKMYIFDVILIL